MKLKMFPNDHQIGEVGSLSSISILRVWILTDFLLNFLYSCTRKELHYRATYRVHCRRCGFLANKIKELGKIPMLGHLLKIGLCCYVVVVCKFCCAPVIIFKCPP